MKGRLRGPLLCLHTFGLQVKAVKQSSEAILFSRLTFWCCCRASVRLFYPEALVTGYVLLILAVFWLAVQTLSCWRVKVFVIFVLKV